MNGVTPSILHPLADEQDTDNALAQKGLLYAVYRPLRNTTRLGNAVCVRICLFNPIEQGRSAASDLKQEGDVVLRGDARVKCRGQLISMFGVH